MALILDCTVLFFSSSFDGFQHIDENFTFGPRYPAMDPYRLESFSTVKEIAGFLNTTTTSATC